MDILLNTLMNKNIHKNNEPKSKQNLQKTDLEIINTLRIILTPTEDQQHHVTLVQAKPCGIVIMPCFLWTTQRLSIISNIICQIIGNKFTKP